MRVGRYALDHRLCSPWVALSDVHPRTAGRSRCSRRTGRGDAAVRTARDAYTGSLQLALRACSCPNARARGTGTRVAPRTWRGRPTGEPSQNDTGTDANVMRHMRNPLCRLRRVLIAREWAVLVAGRRRPRGRCPGAEPRAGLALVNRRRPAGRVREPTASTTRMRTGCPSWRRVGHQSSVVSASDSDRSAQTGPSGPPRARP